MLQPNYNKSFSEKYAKPVIKAIKCYGMISKNQKVAVALSGGKDSITLLYILKWLSKFSFLKFELLAIHIETYRVGETDILKKLCNELDVPLIIEKLRIDKSIPNKSICSMCAKLKRGAMNALCEKLEISCLAFGHHATDAAETLFMNMFINKKLGSFSPVVRVPNSKTRIIRPMIYLTEDEIISIHKSKELPVSASPCPYEAKNIRKDYKNIIRCLSNKLAIKDLEKNIVSALENVDNNNLYSIEKLK